MAEEKCQTLNVMTLPPSYRDAPVQKQTEERTKTKKYVIIGVAIVLVIAIAVGGTLGGMHLAGKINKEAIENFQVSFQNEQGKIVKEDIYLDFENERYQYDVGEQNFHVIQDEQRGIVIYKVKLQGYYACFLRPLKDSDRLDDSTLISYQQHTDEEGTLKSNKNETSAFVVTEIPVLDKSFLGGEAQQTCSDVSTHWLQPKLTTEKEDEKLMKLEPKRVKRAFSGGGFSGGFGQQKFHHHGFPYYLNNGIRFYTNGCGTFCSSGDFCYFGNWVSCFELHFSRCFWCNRGGHHFDHFEHLHHLRRRLHHRRHSDRHHDRHHG